MRRYLKEYAWGMKRDRSDDVSISLSNLLVVRNLPDHALVLLLSNVLGDLALHLASAQCHS